MSAGKFISDPYMTGNSFQCTQNACMNASVLGLFMFFQSLVHSGCHSQINGAFKMQQQPQQQHLPQFKSAVSQGRSASVSEQPTAAAAEKTMNDVEIGRAPGSTINITPASVTTSVTPAATAPAVAPASVTTQAAVQSVLHDIELD